MRIIPGMPQLELLRPDHAPAVLDFEKVNRAYFAASISDRGDDFFADFDERYATLLADQATGECFFHVLVDDGGEVLGRFNLVGVEDGSAELGYRVAERAVGRGLATATVRELCTRAAAEYGLTSLWARTTLDNPGSRGVLDRTGFVPTGEIEIVGRPGLRFARQLVTPSHLQ
jgi:[ribosomal protein S5]-alanine N-acetyltransferase